MSDRKKKPTRLNATLYALLLEDLVHGTATRQEMGEHTGLSTHTIQSLVTALHKRGLIHIAAWERDGRGRFTIAAFAFGNKPDTKRPAPKTVMQCKRDQRARAAVQYAHHAIAGTARSGVQVEVSPA